MTIQLRTRTIRTVRPKLTFKEVCRISSGKCKTVSSSRNVTYTVEHRGTRSITLCDGERLIALVLKPEASAYTVFIDGGVAGKAHSEGDDLMVGWNESGHDDDLEAAHALTMLGAAKKKKRKISKTLKDLLWTQWVGETKATAPCYCCLERGSHTIYMRSFEAAHIVSVAKGGEDTIENMRPSCGRCNRGTATKSMDEFQASILNFKVTVSDPRHHVAYVALE